MLHPLKGALRIPWEDSDGREVISKAQIVDASDSGLKLESGRQNSGSHLHFM